MGVTGLWRLVEPAGKPVPVETLENKVLAVDISIWLHQMVKGYQDAKGAPLANAHLMGLFQRVCKLLYFRIKPVFVFDGGFPELKRETIAKRQDNKSKYNSESERLKRELALILGKKTAIGSLLGKQISPKKGHAADASNNDDIFKLPAIPQREEEMESESEDESDSSGSTIDLHSVDLGSDNFKSLPMKEKYDLLLELKETRKMNSWGKLHELPKKSDNFSDFQMQRLLKRRKVQECLEETEKEMGDSGMSLNDLESLLNEEGIDTKIDSLPTRRIASNNNTRFLLINDVKQALAEAKKKREAENQPSTSKIEEESTNEDNIKPLKRDELEDDLEKAIKMSLECVNEADTSACTSKTDDSWTSVMTDSDDTDSEEEDGHAEPDLSSAKSYIMQYSDFTRKTIDDIVTTKHNSNKGKWKVPKVDKIIDELNKEKSVIVDNVELSSDDDCGDNPKAPNKITSHENVLEDNSVDTSYPTVISTEEINPIEKSIMNQLELKSKNEPKLCIDNKHTGGVLNQSIIELDTSEDFECSIHDDDNVDETQASIMCIEDCVQDIITLDTSTEEDGKLSETPLDLKSKKQDFEKSVESDSSDDEFEDVPEIENKTTKPVVQLTLNIMDETLDDDLFADVFADKNKPAVKPSSVENTVTEIVKQQQAVNKDHEKKLVGKISEVETVEISNNKTVKIINQSPSAIQDNSRTNQPQPGCSHESDIKNTTKISREMDAMETDQPTKEPLSTETLNTMVEELQNEEQGLLQEKGRLDRIGRNITEQMTQEAQELLQIFGIPYIVAPTEAEAQCAFLESVKLTDGTITDDSDIWLFGGRTVYKNFFNQKKHVLQFLAERIERSFNLTREQLVLLALLVGSDYTTGVTGVGPVTALEILASFPFNKKQVMNETSKQARFAQMVGGLEEFKKWMQSGKKTDNTTLKKKLKNVDLTNEFPSIRVVQAYLEPNVEKSEEKFTWGELDTTVLRDYTKAKFGWSQNKLDEIIKPVLKRIQDSKSQRSVQDYFKRKIEFQSLEEQMSKRVKAAVQKMGPEAPIQQPKESAKVKAKPTRKRKVNSKIVNETEGCNIETKQSEVPSEEKVLNDLGVRVVSHTDARKSSIEIKIPKTDRVHEIIPQREKEKQSHLQNKMKAIEIFRKTKMDRKKKPTKKRANLPKEKADLSESSDCD